MKSFYTFCLIIFSMLLQAQEVTLYEFTGEVLTPMEAFPNATTSDFQVTGTTPTFSTAQSSTWSGSGVPVAQSGSDWDAENADDAKYFFFTVNADDGFEMDAESISFEWRSTGNGPSAITVEINGVEIATFDAPANETTLFSAPVTFEDETEFDVRIKGWDNGSRDTPGSGILRLNDVRLEGNIYATTSVLIANPSEVTDLSYIEANGPSAANSISISGENLNGTDVAINLSANSDFEIAEMQDATYGESINLSSFDGSETDIYVRLKSGLSPGMYNDQITLMGGGADAITVDLTGQVDEDIFLIYEFTGEVLSPVQAPANAVTSDFQVTETTPTFNNTASHNWTGSGVPVAQSGSDWGAENTDDAKYFFFTVDAFDGFEMNLSNISFEWRATANGPSAITVEINGTEISTFDVPANETTIFTAPLTVFDNLSDIEVRIKGWDNGSRDTPGTGILRVNDVRLDGDIFATTSVIVANPINVENLNYIEGSGPSQPQPINVSGIDLDGTDVSIALPADSNFEIAENEMGTYSQSIVLPAFTGEDTEIYVRLKEDLTEGSYNDEISLTGGGSDPINVAVAGEVGEVIFLIYEFSDESPAPTQAPENATTTNFDVNIDGPVGFGNAQASTWSAGSGVPYATSQENWAEINAEDAKYFFFTLTADDGYQMDANNISFEWRATGNGPSAITVEINGIEIETVDAPSNETTVFSAPITGAENLSEIEIRIKGWDNGSRDTSGGGFFRINDVRLDGVIEESLSTSEFAQNQSISIFPNPSKNGQFSIQTKAISQGEASLHIYNLVGQQVFKSTYLAQDEILVDASRLTNGIYIVVLSQKNVSFTKKLIIE